MYFRHEAQARIISRFSFALRDGGFIVLGKAEMLLNVAGTFAPVDMKHRVCQKVFVGRLQLLVGGSDVSLGTKIIFIDVTRQHDLQEELQRSREELETGSGNRSMRYCTIPIAP